MAKDIKLNKNFFFHLKLLTYPSLLGRMVGVRRRRCRRGEGTLPKARQRRWGKNMSLNYFIQSSILFFYSFIYKFAMFLQSNPRSSVRKKETKETVEEYTYLPSLHNGIVAGEEIINTSPLQQYGQIYPSSLATSTSPYFHQPSLHYTTLKERGDDNGWEGSAGSEGPEYSLNTYLTGLFEGDGHIWIPNINYNSSKKHNPRFCITFHLKDKPLAEKLLKSIGYGFIRIKLKENACVLTVSPLKGLIYVIRLLNGNMRTPKIHQLHSLIDWVNTHHNFNINKLYLSTSPLNSDSWLAGFLEADGCFLIRHSTLATSKKERISCSCVIEQRLIDPKSNENYFKILDEIANLFDTKLLITNRNYYRITATSLKSISLVIKYLEQFNLRGSKYLDSLDWIEAVKLIICNNHYTLEGKNRIDLLKNRMNRNRINIDWEHLNKY